jgi:hypothetical protein
MKPKNILYKCHFPECKYNTTHRSKIDFHHVTPKEVDSSDRNKITLPFCKTHHALIFHPLAKYGQHSIATEESLQILGIFGSTIGKAVLYEAANGRQFYYTADTGEYIN